MGDHICRRLILFLDGTWNEDEEDLPSSNIVYLRERLSWGLNVRVRQSADDQRNGRQNDDDDAYQKLPPRFRKKGITGVVLDGFEYIVHYDRGVGTGAYLDSLKGGVFGDGLDQNIREAYRFLSNWYRPGDEIFVFGFSRGSFTARSLCGYLQAIGLLRCEQCTPENEQRAWRYYRTPPGDRLSGEWAWFNRKDTFGQSLVHDSRYFRVRALCVFDTVGALGIPMQGFRKINRLKYQFHDTEVNALVDIRLHAMAIDEPRKAFAPSLWTAPKFKRTVHDRSPTEQVWFAGAHSDVGGGYVRWTRPKTTGLSFLPLAWMMQRLEQLVIATEPIAEEPVLDTALPPQRRMPIPFYKSDLLEEHAGVAGSVLPTMQGLSYAEQHEPWAKLYTVHPRNWRIINQQSLANGASERSSGRVPYGDPICEMVHISALQRLNRQVTVDRGEFLNRCTWPKAYAPDNLVGIIPYLAATYIRCPVDTPWRGIVKPIYTWKEARVVGWDGKPFEQTSAGAQRAFSLLPTPDQIGVSEMPEEMKFILDPRTA